jgi:uncharacterized protein (TIRG00374 family)
VEGNILNKQVKNCGVLFIKISLIVLIGYYLFTRGFLTKESFTTLFAVPNLPFVFLSGLLFMLSVILSAWRIILLLKTVCTHLQFFQGFRLTLIGFFFNLALPGVIGGDVVKGFYLIQYERSHKGKSAGIVVIDRVVGLLAMMGVGCISILYLLSQRTAHLRFYQKELYGIFSIASLLFALSLIFLVVGRNPHIRRALKNVAIAILGRSFLYYMMNSVATVLTQYRTLTLAFLMSLLIQLFSIAGVLVLGKIPSEDLPTDIVTLMAVSSLVLLLGVIPITPGNLGWTELLAAYGWSAVGSNAGAEIFLYWRIITVLCSLPGGILYFLMFHSQKPIVRTGAKSEKIKTSILQNNKKIP